jgi:hypothetical protein
MKKCMSLFLLLFFAAAQSYPVKPIICDISRKDFQKYAVLRELFPQYGCERIAKKMWIASKGLEEKERKETRENMINAHIDKLSALIFEEHMLVEKLYSNVSQSMESNRPLVLEPINIYNIHHRGRGRSFGTSERIAWRFMPGQQLKDSVKRVKNSHEISG